MEMERLQKEMYNVGGVFEVLEDGAQSPQGWKKVTGYLVWDIKMDFTHQMR